MQGARAAAIVSLAIAFFATDCAASSASVDSNPVESTVGERFDHAPLTAQYADVSRPPSSGGRAASTAVATVEADVAAPAAMPPSRPMPPAAPLPAWDVRASDGTIRGVLTRWAHSAGWQLVWDAPVDFSIDAQATLHGSFEDVLQTLVASLGRTSTPIQAILYRGNHVLRVVAQGAG
ncbi:toxin co-regulated pilus biosynthesis Q family protein [Burkholderia alba]|uniref:toxin co-regulated pilus biosynthesis Q family protein n=1 Tax=Burkholderia alba TaxID=2683677 RepID=UPI002B0578CF|nr:toxin co-regulated pilus biosynthesis Q family protein [Burkholderia alba]